MTQKKVKYFIRFDRHKGDKRNQLIKNDNASRKKIIINYHAKEIKKLSIGKNVFIK